MLSWKSRLESNASWSGSEPNAGVEATGIENDLNLISKEKELISMLAIYPDLDGL